jgi:enoyl-CoA hydratase/carnithine racemase
MSTPGDIAIDVNGGVAILRLRNPAHRNAVSVEMWRAIAKFASQVGTRSDVRLVAIRGDGDTTFSSGADISGFASARSGTSNARDYDDLVEDTCRLIEGSRSRRLASSSGHAWVRVFLSPRAAT